MENLEHFKKRLTHETVMITYNEGCTATLGKNECKGL
jgi:hypothetical protein